MTKRILAFGKPVYDMIVTPVITRRERVLSGCSTNACLALAKLGAQATLVGMVGPDFEEHMRADMRKYNVEGILLPSKETGGFSLIYDERGDRELTILGVADDLPDAVEALPDADIVLIGPILGETSPALVRFIKSKSNAPIFLDPQGTLRFLKGDDVAHELTDMYREIAAMSTVVKANEMETEVITGVQPRQDPEKAVRELYRSGCQIAITTLAEAGSIIYDGKRVYEIPPFTTHAIDPTGAGDTYAAGFMFKYLEDPTDLVAAGCFGSAVSSVMVENVGPSFPLTLDEALRRQQSLLQGPKKLKL